MQRMRHLLPVVALWVAVAPVFADPEGTPAATPVFTVTCTIDGQTEVFHLVATGVAGHVLEDNRTAVLLNATFTFYVNGEQVSQTTYVTPGPGRRGVPCSAIAEFQDEADNTVRIEITDAEILLTPPKKR
ncbi:MAG TPA: hypothetical protein VFC90_05610 [Planctomycetota bacterium]|nr:hypothetical protein [Planctomycetota bacterium]